MKSHCHNTFNLLELLLFSSCLTLFASYGFGQAATTGAIQGTVTDATGAFVPGAEVTVTLVSTGRTLTVTTNSEGFYSADGLAAGSYDVSVKKEGFKTATTRALNLDAGLRLGNNVTLQVGEITEQVNVTAEALRVQTESGESAGVISGDEVQEILINGRDFTSLAALVPGINLTSGSNSRRGGGFTQPTDVSVNGLGLEFSNFQIDGTYNMNTGCNCQMNVTSPLDTISEFRVLKDNYSAKYGITGNANFLVETKSGTKEFHGNLYEYLRNDALDAKNFFDVGKTPLKQNNFGFTFGGPFYVPGKYNQERKKTFFFVNEEWRRSRRGDTLRGAFPTEEMRNGDFRNSPTVGPGGLAFDPIAVSTLAELYPGLNCLPAPSQLNPGCFDQNAVKLMDRYWPLPNNIRPGVFENYLNPAVTREDQRSDTYRLDHLLSEKYSVMFRWSHEIVDNLAPTLSWGGGNVTPRLRQRFSSEGLNALLRFTANISPTTINQATITHTHSFIGITGINTELPSDIHIRPIFPNADPHHSIPAIYIQGGWAPLSAEGVPEFASHGEWSYSDDFSHVKGSHVLQAGGVYIFGIHRQNNFTQGEGLYVFSGLHSGDPIADYLLGLNTFYLQRSGEQRGSFHYRHFEPYFQDDWKVNPRLTLNLGLRYQYFSPDSLEDDIYTNFDPALWKSEVAPEVLPSGQLVLDSQARPLTSTGIIAQIYNGLNCPGRDRQFGDPVYHCPRTHRGVFPPWRWGFAPRVGAAWDVFGNGKTSLRGGYGIGYSRLSYPQFGSLSNPPFVLTVTRFGGTLTDPAFGSELLKSPSPITYVFPDAKPSRVHSWSLSIQRELMPNAILDVAYVGSKAQRLHLYVDFNFPAIGTKPSIADPNCLQPGQDPNGTYDFDPCINGFVATPDYTRPFKGWGNLDTYYGGGPNFGFSNYHSLQAGFKYKATMGLNLTSAYTWGKALSNVKGNGGDPWSGGRSGQGAQNPKRFDLEYGPTGFDRTHILNIGYVYQLPLWRSRKDWRGQVFGHWTLSGITYLMSGFPYYPYLATPTPGLAQRPNVLPGINVKGPKTVEKWFNTETFVEPAWGFFGNAGTGIIRGPGEHTWHTALYKAFPIREKTKLQFRAEFYNIFNHPNFDSIGVGLGAGNFGQVISAKEPRILQFGLRLDF